MSSTYDEIAETVEAAHDLLGDAERRATDLLRRCQDIEAEIVAADDDRTRSRLISDRCTVGLELAHLSNVLRGSLAGIALAAGRERDAVRLRAV